MIWYKSCIQERPSPLGAEMGRGSPVCQQMREQIIEMFKQYSTSASGVGKGYSRPSGAGNNTRGNIPYLPHSHEYYIAFIKQFYSQPINI